MSLDFVPAAGMPDMGTPAPGSVRDRCRDRALPLWERLEALEDLADSEVGDTPLLRARGLERRFGLRQLYLKVEGDNPTGTQKDRIAFDQVDDALRRGFGGVCFATCGNYGVAMAYACSVVGLDCVAVVPTSYAAPRVAQITALGGRVVRAGHDYEGAVDAARALATAEALYDANPGGANEALQLRAYKRIAAEVVYELRDAPAAVAVPVSNGTTLAGIARGFQSMERRGRASRIPAVVAGSTHRKNPIVRAWREGLARCEDLDPASVRETSVNEPLVNWRAIDGDLALQAIRDTGGFARDVADRRMRELSRFLKQDQGLLVLPAATAGLAALLVHHERHPLAPDRYVAVLTGRSA